MQKKIKHYTVGTVSAPLTGEVRSQFIGFDFNLKLRLSAVHTSLQLHNVFSTSLLLDPF